MLIDCERFLDNLHIVYVDVCFLNDILNFSGTIGTMAMPVDRDIQVIAGSLTRKNAVCGSTASGSIGSETTRQQLACIIMMQVV